MDKITEKVVSGYGWQIPNEDIRGRFFGFL